MPFSLTESQKLDHVLRRFGLGAGRYERKKFEKLGAAKALDTLLNDEKLDDGFPISPWEFAAQPDGRIDTGAYHLAGFWALRLFLTQRPLEQKLSLFWHDHFAVDFEKVYEFPMMLGYLETIRTLGRGKFQDLLTALFRQGALYTYLDQHTSNRIHPNENFARELMELFTLGEGNYMEKDVLEAARALTGWSVHYLGTGLQYNYETLRAQAAKSKLGLNNACYVPAVHDDTNKTIFGITKNWDVDSLIEHLCNHPQTARFICTKLWEYFAYANPEKVVVDRLAGVWKKTGGDIRSILKAIGTSPEFWSEKCYMQRTKSPMDYTIGLYRSLGLGPIVLQLRGTPTNEFQPIKKEVRDTAGGLYYFMTRQGMSLLLPPNVAGWDWGEAWINPATTVERLNMSNAIFWGGGAARPFAVWLASKLKTEDSATTSDKIVDGMADILDIPISEQSRPALVAMCEKHGGPKALENKDQAANLFARLSRAMFAIPDFQLC
jgi:uncharacterized protein (DUF1800 family)